MNIIKNKNDKNNNICNKSNEIKSSIKIIFLACIACISMQANSMDIEAMNELDQVEAERDRVAATKIQATWRGYQVRQQTESAPGQQRHSDQGSEDDGSSSSMDIIDSHHLGLPATVNISNAPTGIPTTPPPNRKPGRRLSGASQADSTQPDQPLAQSAQSAPGQRELEKNHQSLHANTQTLGDANASDANASESPRGAPRRACSLPVESATPTSPAAPRRTQSETTHDRGQARIVLQASWIKNQSQNASRQIASFTMPGRLPQEIPVVPATNEAPGKRSVEDLQDDKSRTGRSPMVINNPAKDESVSPVAVPTVGPYDICRTNNLGKTDSAPGSGSDEHAVLVTTDTVDSSIAEERQRSDEIVAAMQAEAAAQQAKDQGVADVNLGETGEEASGGGIRERRAVLVEKDKEAEAASKIQNAYRKHQDQQKAVQLEPDAAREPKQCPATQQEEVNPEEPAPSSDAAQGGGHAVDDDIHNLIGQLSMEAPHLLRQVREKVVAGSPQPMAGEQVESAREQVGPVLSQGSATQAAAGSQEEDSLAVSDTTQNAPDSPFDTSLSTIGHADELQEDNGGWKLRPSIGMGLRIPHHLKNLRTQQPLNRVIETEERVPRPRLDSTDIESGDSTHSSAEVKSFDHTPKSTASSVHGSLSDASVNAREASAEAVRNMVAALDISVEPQPAVKSTEGLSSTGSKDSKNAQPAIPFHKLPSVSAWLQFKPKSATVNAKAAPSVVMPQSTQSMPAGIPTGSTQIPVPMTIPTLAARSAAPEASDRDAAPTAPTRVPVMPQPVHVPVALMPMQPQPQPVYAPTIPTEEHTDKVDVIKDDNSSFSTFNSDIHRLKRSLLDDIDATDEISHKSLTMDISSSDMIDDEDEDEI